MKGSSFERKVDGNTLQVGQSLLMHERATFKDKVDLLAAKIDGQLSLDCSTIEKGVEGDSLQVGRDLGVGRAVFCGRLSLLFAQVGGSLHLEGATPGVGSPLGVQFFPGQCRPDKTQFLCDRGPAEVDVFKG